MEIILYTVINLFFKCVDFFWPFDNDMKFGIVFKKKSLKYNKIVFCDKKKRKQKNEMGSLGTFQKRVI